MALTSSGCWPHSIYRLTPLAAHAAHGQAPAPAGSLLAGVFYGR